MSLPHPILGGDSISPRCETVVGPIAPTASQGQTQKLDRAFRGRQCPKLVKQAADDATPFPRILADASGEQAAKLLRLMVIAYARSASGTSQRWSDWQNSGACYRELLAQASLDIVQAKAPDAVSFDDRDRSMELGSQWIK